MASLSLRNVSKVYRREVRAVEDFNLEIDDKEFIVISGPSGSGKSALMRMLVGLEKVTSGEIYMDGRRIDQLPARQRNIAFLSQDSKLNSFQTIEQNIRNGMKGMSLSAAEQDEHLHKAADILDLNHLLDRRPKTLSEGQKQRVALARAIISEPKVLVMDAPLSKLDGHTRAHLRTRLSMLHKQLQATFVLVTSDSLEGMTMATRVIIMNDGRIQQSDTPQNLYDFPENRFVAGFVGLPEMNIFKARLQVVGGEGVCAVFGDNRLKIPSGKLQRFTSDSYIGKEVYMGIRPENLHDEDAFLSVAEDSTIEVTVEHIELLGSQTHLFLAADGLEHPLIASVSPRSTARQGDRITIGFDTNRLHFFDGETGKTILLRI